MSKVGLGAIDRIFEAREIQRKTLVAVIEDDDLLAQAIAEAERIVGGFDRDWHPDQDCQAEGDYLLAVKHNQGKLYRDLEMLFSYDQQKGFEEAPYDYPKEVKKGHGRIDVRECWVTSDPEYLASVGQGKKWANLQSIVMIVRRRIIDGQDTIKTRFYISTLQADAKRILRDTRQH